LISRTSALPGKFYDGTSYKYEGKQLSSKDMLAVYEEMVSQYPIISIEDGMAEQDKEGWKLITQSLGSKVLLVGDDVFVTNQQYSPRV